MKKVVLDTKNAELIKALETVAEMRSRPKGGLSEIEDAMTTINRWKKLSGLEINSDPGTILVGCIKDYQEVQRIFGKNTKVVLLVNKEE